MAKVILIAATSKDGFIAKDANHLADWTSKEDKRHFVQVTKQSGVMIVGRKTFDTFPGPLPGRKTIVMSHMSKDIDGVKVTTDPPDQIIEKLTAEGYESVCVIGGKQIYGLFLDAGLVDEIQLTVEPVEFGHGMTLFDGDELDMFNLSSQQNLNDDTLLLIYKAK